MAYDLALAERIRRIVGPRADVIEKHMFGGIAWLLDAKMFVGIVKDELMVRVGKDAHDDAIARPHARTMDFTGRPMLGYVFVAGPGVKTPKQIEVWVAQALAHVATLPAKKPTKVKAKPFPRKTKARR